MRFGITIGRKAGGYRANSVHSVDEKELSSPNQSYAVDYLIGYGNDFVDERVIAWRFCFWG